VLVRQLFISHVLVRQLFISHVLIHQLFVNHVLVRQTVRQSCSHSVILLPRLGYPLPDSYRLRHVWPGSNADPPPLTSPQRDWFSSVFPFLNPG
jgi:hypothetical protein